MKRLTAALGAIAAPLLLGGCTRFGVFEDVGSDPHPPTMRVEQVLVQPPEAAAKAARVIAFDTHGLEVVSGAKLQIRLSFTDAGGDVVNFHFRDRDGSLSIDGVPGAPELDLDGDGEPETTLDPPEYFAGTAGIVTFRDIEFSAKMIGPHRIEVWAVDSHESRSEKVEFVVTVVLP